MVVPETCYDRIEGAIRGSLGLEDDVSIDLDKPFGELDPNIEPLDFLEIFSSIGVSPVRLKPYLGEGGLTVKGKSLFGKIKGYVKGREVASNNTKYLDMIEGSDNLNELARSATYGAVLNLMSYLESKHVFS